MGNPENNTEIRMNGLGANEFEQYAALGAMKPIKKDEHTTDTSTEHADTDGDTIHNSSHTIGFDPNHF